MISLAKAMKAKRAAREAALCAERQRLAARMTEILARTREPRAFCDARTDTRVAEQIHLAQDTMDDVA